MKTTTKFTLLALTVAAAGAAIIIPKFATANQTPNAANVDYSNNHFIGNYDINKAQADYLNRTTYRFAHAGVAAYNEVVKELYDLAEDSDDMRAADNKAEKYVDTYILFNVLSRNYAEGNNATTVGLNFNPANVTYTTFLTSLQQGCQAGQFNLTTEGVAKYLNTTLTTKETRKVNERAYEYKNFCTLVNQYIALENAPEFAKYKDALNKFADIYYQEFKTFGYVSANINPELIQSDRVEKAAWNKFRDLDYANYKLLKDLDDDVEVNSTLRNLLLN